MTSSQKRIGQRPIAGSIMTEGIRVSPIKTPSIEKSKLMNEAKMKKRSVKWVVPS